MNKTVVKKPTARKPAAKKTAAKLVESQESVQVRELTSKLAALDKESVTKILNNASNTSQTVFDVVMDIADNSTPTVPKPELMPWRPLVDVFISNRHFAEERAKESLARCQSFITKEFRTLIIGGCRQTGKTQLAHDIVRENPKARLINAPYKSIVPIVTEQVLKERTISDIDDLRNFTINKDIELLVINQDGFSFEKRNPYMELLNCLEDSSNEFPPNMQVIWIL